MLDYAITFYNNYIVIFYIFLILAVIIEGPITILLFSLIAPKIDFSFILVYFFAFLGEFLGDLLHYVLGRFFKKNIFKDKKFEIFEKFEKKLEKHSLFEKLLVIKYTPPITSIGLLYLGFQKVDIIKFLKNIFIFSILNSALITFIGYHFSFYLIDKKDFKYIIIGLMFSFLILYFTIKLVSSYFVKNILNDKK